MIGYHSSMELPRWLLVSLIAISAVALLALPAWLWVQMPRWTAQKFVAAIEARDVDRINELLIGLEYVALGRHGDITCRLFDRDTRDILCGCQPMGLYVNGFGLDELRARCTGVERDLAWEPFDGFGLTARRDESQVQKKYRAAFSRSGSDSNGRSYP